MVNLKIFKNNDFNRSVDEIDKNDIKMKKSISSNRRWRLPRIKCSNEGW